MEKYDMSTFWPKPKLDWYLSAAANCSYHEDLAQAVLPWIPAGSSVCDIGCGPGCLTLELLRHLRKITAIDRDRNALASLRERSADLPGLELLDTDAMALPKDAVWDCLVMSFFGQLSVEGNLEYFLSHCRKRIIFIINGAEKRSFSATGTSVQPEKEFAPQVSALLARKHIIWRKQSLELEFGQPLSSLEEAREFIEYYTPPGRPELTEQALREKLIARPDGSWYMPHRKQIAIFIIDKEDNDHEKLS